MRYNIFICKNKQKKFQQLNPEVTNLFVLYETRLKKEKGRERL